MKPDRALGFVAILMVAAVVLSACGNGTKHSDPSVEIASDPSPSPDSPLVILISLDTLRADHLGCYGYGRDTSPNIDAFARDAVLFEKAFTSEVWTLTAHMTMLTGLYPKHHGLSPSINIPDDVITLGEHLQSAGYATAGFTGHQWWFLPSRGYGRGFDVFSIPENYRDVHAVYADAQEWLDDVDASPFFLFLHAYDIHSKYDHPLPYDSEDDRFRAFTSPLAPPPAFKRDGLPRAVSTAFLAAHNRGDLVITPEEQTYLEAGYDDSIAKLDYVVGELLEDLKQANQYDNSLIIITSDHGESLGDHGEHIHGTVYEENIRVPLLIKFPDNQFAGRRLDGMVELADLMPTALDVSGLAIPDGLDGRSLIPLIAGEAAPVAEIYSLRGEWRAIRTATHKLLRNTAENRYEFYDLSADPGESSNLIGQIPERENPLRQQLTAFFDAEPGSWHIALDGDGENWEVEFQVNTDTRIEAVRMLDGHLLDSGQENALGTYVGVNVELSESRPADVLVLGLDPPDSEATVRIRSTRPFVALDSAGWSEPQTEIEIKLSLDSYPTERPTQFGDTANLPRVSVWFDPVQSQGTQAETLSEEAQEVLRGLGYLE